MWRDEAWRIVSGVASHHNHDHDHDLDPAIPRIELLLSFHLAVVHFSYHSSISRH